MIPVPAVPVLEKIATATTTNEIIQVLPAVQDYLMKLGQPSDWNDSDKELLTAVSENFQKLMLNGNDQFHQQALEFQKLSHERQLEFIALFDVSKLESADMGRVIETKIKSEHQSSIVGMLVKGVLAVVTILATADAVSNQQKHNYNLKRPRSLSEKLFGDNK